MSRKSRLVVPTVVLCGALQSFAAAHAKSPCGPPLLDHKDPEAAPSTAKADDGSYDDDGNPSATERYLMENGQAPSRAPASSRAIARDSGDSGGDEDEYNFSWLDPDKKVYVLQNRKYRKKGRVALFLGVGTNLSNPYQTEYPIVGRAAYWFSEQFGIELLYASVSNHDSSNLTALENVSASALPFVRQNRSYYGGLITWTPWYAKLNFFNKILYFDWTFNAGGGQSDTFINTANKAGQTPNYVEQDLATIFYGTDLMFYVTKNFLVRFDLIGMMYNAVGPDNSTKSYIQNYDFTAGIGWAF